MKYTFTANVEGKNKRTSLVDTAREWVADGYVVTVENSPSRTRHVAVYTWDATGLRPVNGEMPRTSGSLSYTREKPEKTAYQTLVERSETARRAVQKAEWCLADDKSSANRKALASAKAEAKTADANLAEARRNLPGYAEEVKAERTARNLATRDAKTSARRADAWRAVGEATSDEEKAVALAKAKATKDVVIRADTVLPLAGRITLKALRRCWARDGLDGTRRLYASAVEAYRAVVDGAEIENLGDGYDVLMATAEFLLGYVGKRLSDVWGKGKDGKPVTIFQRAFRLVGNGVKARTRDEARRASMTESTPDAKASEALNLAEVESKSEEEVNDAIASLNLTPTQAKVLSYLEGGSVKATAKAVHRTPKTVRDTRKGISKKYIAKFGEPSFD